MRRLGEASYLAAAALLPFLPLAFVFRLPAVSLTMILVAVPIGVGIGSLVVGASPKPQLHALDVVVAVFLLVAVVDACIFTADPSTALAHVLAQGAGIALYASARAFGLDRSFAPKLFSLILVIAAFTAVVGLLEYALRWGESLISAGVVWRSSYWAERVPRLYSLIPTPLVLALFLDVAACAAVARWVGGGRWLPAAAMGAAVGAVLLTLTPFALVAATAMPLAAAFAWPRARGFAWVVLGSIAIGIALALACDATAGLAAFARTQGIHALAPLPPDGAIESFVAAFRPPLPSPVGRWTSTAAAAAILVLAFRTGIHAQGELRAFLVLAVPLAAVFPLFERVGPTLWLPLYVLLPCAVAVNEARRVDA